MHADCLIQTAEVTYDKCVAEAARCVNAIFLETANAEKFAMLQKECKSVILAMHFWGSVIESG